jgi:RraA family protein
MAMDAALRAELLAVDCAALADADKSLRVLDAGIRAMKPGAKLVGPARTVRCHEDFLAVIRGLEAARPGEVLMVDTAGSRRAVVGELFSLEAARRGLAGIIVDGLVRDVRTLRELDLPVYARGLCPTSGTVRDFGAIDCPIVCGGVSVAPGDIVVADDDGVVVASAEHFIKILPAAREVERREAIVRERIAAGVGLIDMTNFSEHVARVARDEASRLAFRLEE